MWNKKMSVMLSIVICFVFSAVLTAALFLGPWAVETWLNAYRGWEIGTQAMHYMLKLFKLSFYPCAVFAYITLYSLIKLLFNIKNNQIFINSNLKYLRRISWCCFAVAAITLVSGVCYIPYLFIAVAAAFVGLMLRVVKNVMQNAVFINEENELTI